MKSKDDKKGKLLPSMLKSAYAAWDTGAFRKNAEYDAVAQTVMDAAEREDRQAEAFSLFSDGSNRRTGRRPQR